MKRKYIWLLLGTLVCISLMSCGDSSSQVPDQPFKQVVSPPKTTTAPTEEERVSQNQSSNLSYTLYVKIEPENSGYVVPNIGVYSPGEEVTLSAIAASGHSFVSWGGNITGTDSEISIIMDSDKTVIAQFIDIIAPKTSGVRVLWTTDTGAEIIWKTDEETTSQVKYGTTTDYGLTSSQDTSLTHDHSVTLSDLYPDTSYHFITRSADRDGNESFSKDATFSTKNHQECVVPVVHSASVFAKSLHKLEYSLTNNSSVVMQIKKMVLIDENGRDKEVEPAFITHENAPDGKIPPGVTCYWDIMLESPLLAIDIDTWQMKWYCIDDEGREFVVICNFPP